MLKLSKESQGVDLNVNSVENRIAKMESDQQRILRKIERTREQAQKILRIRTDKERKLNQIRDQVLERDKRTHDLQIKNMKDRQLRERSMEIYKENKLKEMNEKGQRVRDDRELYAKLKYKMI